MKEGLENLEDVGSKWGGAYFPMLLAEGYFEIGDKQQANIYKQRAEKFAKKVGGYFYLSRLS